MATYRRLVVTDRYAITITSVSLKQDPTALDKQEGCVKFDCRELNNPHNVPSLRGLMGTSDAIIAFVQASPKFAALWNKVKTLLDRYFEKGGEVDIRFVCIGGKHRSVALTELAFQYLLKCQAEYL